MKILLSILLLMLPFRAFAAIAATAQWDVRTAGSDNNGGCFDPGVTSPGTDYSQQTTAQFAYTDLVIGATNTNLTSAGHPFTSATVGNCINVTGGTGFTTGWYEVKSVSGSTATMDRAVGTASSTGGTGNLGGSLADMYAPIVSSSTGAQEYNTLWVQSGTYTLTATPSIGAALPSTLFFVGYNTTHGDNGTAPLVTTSTNSVNLFPASADLAASFTNMTFSNTATTRGSGFSGGTASYYFMSCTLTGFTTAIQPGRSLVLVQTLVQNSTGLQIGAAGSWGIYVLNSQIINGGGDGIDLNAASDANVIEGSIIAGNSGVGISQGGNSSSSDVLRGNVIANNTSDGFFINNLFNNGGLMGAVMLSDNIFYGNGGYGINYGSTTIATYPTNLEQYNAFGSNTSGAIHNKSAGTGDVTLTANPFTASGSGNYSLNSTAGGGALLKGVGYPGTFPGGTTTGHLDIGAAQSAGGGTTIIDNFGSSN